MRGRFDTIRARILIGLALLMAGLIATAIAGAATLRQMRYAIDQELDALRASTEVGSGLVTSVLEEIRAAEQYLGSPGDDPARVPSRRRGGLPAPTPAGWAGRPHRRGSPHREPREATPRGHPD